MSRTVCEIKEAEGDVERCWVALKGLEDVLHEGRKEALKMRREKKKEELERLREN